MVGVQWAGQRGGGEGEGGGGGGEFGGARKRIHEGPDIEVVDDCQHLPRDCGDMLAGLMGRVGRCMGSCARCSAWRSGRLSPAVEDRRAPPSSAGRHRPPCGNPTRAGRATWKVDSPRRCRGPFDSQLEAAPGGRRDDEVTEGRAVALSLLWLPSHDTGTHLRHIAMLPACSGMAPSWASASWWGATTVSPGSVSTIG